MPNSKIAKLFIKIRESLDPKFYPTQTDLDPTVRQSLLDIANDAINGLTSIGLTPPVATIVLTGSETSPDYDSFSDLDLHVIVNIQQLQNPQVYKTLLDLYAKNYNSKKLKIKDHDVELYFQDASDNLIAPGIYDLMAGVWVKHADSEAHEIPAEAKALAKTFSDAIIELKAEFDLSDSHSVETAKEFLVRSDAVMDSIRAMRKEGLAIGLYGNGNLAFKLLRRDGSFDKLDKIKDLAKKTVLGAE